MPVARAGLPQARQAAETPVRITDGAIALVNLRAQIDGLEWQTARERLPLSRRIELAGLLALRGHLLGQIAAYERAAELTERLVGEAPDDGLAFLARARTRATFHRFTDALTDLDQAERLSVDRAALAGERATVFQALGRYEEALALRRAAVEATVDFHTLGALAGLHAERGEVAAAEGLFAECRTRYCGVSPIPLAQLDFQHGRMWLEQGELGRARVRLETACRLLPAYAPAHGHLAEVEAALGKHEAALARLRPLAASSDDPDYAARLARLLGEAGQVVEAARWCTRAAARYDELLTRHPEAFADHAAEFWLTVGVDPQRALELARQNLATRATPRAHALLSRAVLACEAAQGVHDVAAG